MQRRMQTFSQMIQQNETYKDKFEIIGDPKIVSDWYMQQTERKLAGYNLDRFLKEECSINPLQVGNKHLSLLRPKGLPFYTLVAHRNNIDEKVCEFLYRYGTKDMLCIHVEDDSVDDPYVNVYWRWTIGSNFDEEEYAEIAGERWRFAYFYFDEDRNEMIYEFDKKGLRVG